MIGRGRRQPPRRESLREALLRDQPFPLGRSTGDPSAAISAGPRIGLTVALAIAEAGAIAMALLIASYWQATSPAIALPAQARGLAALTELDALLALRSADLQRQFDEGTDQLVLTGFPVHDVAVDRSQAESARGALDLAAYRQALLAASANQLYEDGLGALRPPDVRAITSDRLIDWSIDTLTRHRHSQAAVALLAALGAVALLGVLLLLATRRGRWLAVGLALVGGGALALVLALAARGALGALDTPPGAALTEYASLAWTLLDLPMWNALLALGLGLALIAPGLAGRRRG